MVFVASLMSVLSTSSARETSRLPDTAVTSTLSASWPNETQLYLAIENKEIKSNENRFLDKTSG